MIYTAVFICYVINTIEKRNNWLNVPLNLFHDSHHPSIYSSLLEQLEQQQQSSYNV